MRAILHMGPAKTGSSAIQTWLLENHENLREQGILFCTDVVSKGGNAGLLARGMTGMGHEQEEFSGLEQMAILKRAIDEMRPQTLLISAEAFANCLTLSGHGVFSTRDTTQTPMLANTLKRSLDALGVKQTTAVMVMRNEADRAVSRCVQSFDALLVDPDQNTFPPPESGLMYPYDIVFTALEDAGITVKTLLYKDDSDQRPLMRRLLGAMGLEQETAHLDVTDKRMNVSMGHVACMAYMKILIEINRVYADDPDKIRRARGWAKKPLRAAHERCFSKLAEKDHPFNGIGREMVARIQQKQEKMLPRLARWLSEDEMQALSKTKWSGVPLSSTEFEDMSPDQKAYMHQIIEAFVADIRADTRKTKVIGPETLDAILAETEPG